MLRSTALLLKLSCVCMLLNANTFRQKWKKKMYHFNVANLSITWGSTYNKVHNFTLWKKKNNNTYNWRTRLDYGLLRTNPVGLAQVKVRLGMAKVELCFFCLLSPFFTTTTTKKNITFVYKKLLAHKYIKVSYTIKRTAQSPKQMSSDGTYLRLE